MFFCYKDNCTFFNDKEVIQFIPSTKITETFIEFDSNQRIYKVPYNPKTATYSDIKSLCTPDKGHKHGPINIAGNLKLYPKHTLNNMEITLKPTDKPNQTYLFSCFIDADSTEMVYDENDIGGWLIIPSVYTDLQKLREIILEAINTNSRLFHVSILEETPFEPANILGVDLREKKVKETWDNTIPYGKYPKLYVNEADVIAAFIKEMRHSFPEIEFFPQSSERKNLGKETVFYRSALSRDRSERFNSIILENTESGRFYYTTIPLELFYQTNDVAQYSERRSTYLLHHFFMDVIYFDMIKKRGYPDRFGNRDDVFSFAIYWDRDVEDQLIRADSNDGSGRDTYTLTIRCDLICTLIEKSVKPILIQDVITNIYFGSASNGDGN